MIVWQFAGFYMLILITGLQRIPTDVYEAARIDGASRWQIFRAITLPLLRPTLALMLMLSVTGSLLAFDQFFILTSGGPDNSTATVVHGDLPRGVHALDLGRAAAISVVVLAVLIVLNGAQLRLLRRAERREHEARRRALGRTPYYVAAGGLAVLFLFPLLWTLDVGQRRPAPRRRAARPRQLPAADRLRRRLGTYLFNTRSSSALTVGLTLVVSHARRLRACPLRLPRQEPAVPAHPGDPDGALRHHPDPALHPARQDRPAELADRLGLVLAMFQLPFGLFMMRNSFEALPRELEEAALVDGCGTPGALRRVLLRGVRPGLSRSGCSRSSPSGTSSSRR